MFRHYVYDLVTPIASNTQTRKGCFLGRVGERERDRSISWFKMSITSGVTSSSESHSDRRSVIKEMLWESLRNLNTYVSLSLTSLHLCLHSSHWLSDSLLLRWMRHQRCCIDCMLLWIEQLLGPTLVSAKLTTNQRSVWGHIDQSEAVMMVLSNSVSVHWDDTVLSSAHRLYKCTLGPQCSVNPV